MDKQQTKRISKFLSLVLRHQPDKIGITLDDAGWVAVDELLAGLKRRSRAITRSQLEEVVRENDKQRFSFDESGQRIRANQGHSVTVELGYQSAAPPRQLFHGTPVQFVESIRSTGLKKQQRHHVHLHTDTATSLAVGQRRGKPVLLTIAADRMHSDGHEFFVTPNDVWLTDAVPPEYICFPQAGGATP